MISTRILGPLLDREHSPTSLALLLRDPLGYLWKYGLKLTQPKPGVEPIVLGNKEFGDFTHQVLDKAIKHLGPSLAAKTDTQIEAAAHEALAAARSEWEARFPVPPSAVWRRTLLECHSICVALMNDVRSRHRAFPGMESWSEAPFGSKGPEEQKRPGPWPWTLPAPVLLANHKIAGAIDRVDLAPGIAFVSDYKFGGKMPAKKMQLGKGKELQRTIYSAAVHQLVDAGINVKASLIYPRKKAKPLDLNDCHESLDILTAALTAATDSLKAGRTIPGDGTFDEYNDFLFALPANATLSYWARKKEAAIALLGADATSIWKEA